MRLIISRRTRIYYNISFKKTTTIFVFMLRKNDDEHLINFDQFDTYMTVTVDWFRVVHRLSLVTRWWCAGDTLRSGNFQWFCSDFTMFFTENFRFEALPSAGPATAPRRPCGGPGAAFYHISIKPPLMRPNDLHLWGLMTFTHEA